MKGICIDTSKVNPPLIEGAIYNLEAPKRSDFKSLHRKNKYTFLIPPFLFRLEKPLTFSKSSFNFC